MPTYDYECDACSHTFELYQSIMAEPEKVCPKCKKKKLRRLIGTGAAIVFKGSGFYQTDYRSESYKQSAAAESKKKDSGGTGSESKSESGKSAAAEKSESSKSEKTAATATTNTSNSNSEKSKSKKRPTSDK